MRCRIFHFFLLIILLTFVESWWGRSSSSSSSRSTGSSRRTSVSTTRTTGSSGKSTGWSWRRSTPAIRTTSSTRKPTGLSRKSTGWFWRRRTTRLTRKTGYIKPTTQKPKVSTDADKSAQTPKVPTDADKSAQKPNVSTVAGKYLKNKSTKWGFGAIWNNFKDTKGKYKCNLFVGDVLREANVTVPSYSQGHEPILANDWTNSTSDLILKTGMYEQVPLKDMKEGDIVAFKRNGESGHVGIVSKNKKFISAGSKVIFETSVDGFRNNPNDTIVDTVVWRIKKKS